MLFKKTIIIVSVFLLSLPLFGGGKLERGFQALNVYDYFKAKEIFSKSLKRHECGASFGLSKIYYNDKNPFHNLDSARVYALRSEMTWEESKEKEKLALEELEIDPNAIQSLLASVAKRALEFAVLQNMIVDYDYFIDEYDYSPLIVEATTLKIKLVYADVLRINTASAFKEFISLYPDAVQIDEAKEKYQLRVFEESTSLSRITDIELFINNFPNSPYLKQAQDKLYDLSTQQGRLIDYKNFIVDYPLNPNVDVCWEKIYRLETERLTPGVLVNFLLEYPDYPYSFDVKGELATLLMIQIPTRLNDNWGFIDTSGSWMIKAIFESCEPFKEGMSLVSIDDRFGFVNTRGEVIIETIYEDADSFNNGVAIIFNGEKYGVINRFGEIKIPLEYEDIGDFINGVAYASKNGKYGFINEDGYVIIPFIYDKAFSFNDRMALVKRGGKFGIIDLENNWIIPFNFDWIEPYFQDSLIKVRVDNKLGLINSKVDTILAIEYDQIGKIDQSLILVVKDGKVAYVNPHGDLIIPMIYEADPFIMDWGEFKDGRARIRIKNKMGMIDSTGKRIVPAIFDMIGDFESELFPIKKRGKWGYSDRDIKLKIAYKYDDAFPFHGGLARVRKKKNWGLIDPTGNEVVPLQYSKITLIQGVYIVKNDTAFGMIDYTANTILPPVFDNIEYNDLGFYLIEINGKFAYLDLDRRKVFWKEDGFSIP